MGCPPFDDLAEDALVAWYGRWRPLEPGAVAELLAGSGVRWWVVGGRAVRTGGPARRHADTDVAVPASSLPALRAHLQPAWHLWEAHDGALRPLRPGQELRPDRRQLWLRRDADSPWELDVLLDAGTEQEWVFPRDDRVRLPWAQALQTLDGLQYLRPELVLLHKAHLDRPKDRADLAAAVLDADARDWLVTTLAQLGHAAWARLAARERPAAATPASRIAQA